MYDVILLAGGKGERMGTDIPKPLVVVKNKPILFHQIDYFLPHTNRIIISLGHRADEIEHALQHMLGSETSKRISTVREEKPLGTAGGIKLAAQHAESDMVIVVNCDDITNISIPALNALHENTIVVAHPILPFGLVEEQGGFVVFKEKPTLPLWVSCGWYVLDRKTILKEFPDTGGIEYDVFPRMKVRVHYHEGIWKPLTTKKDITEFSTKEELTPS